ncbi:MAG TPA: hypothetical protein VHG32_10995 [Thermoanaerobaculia bacterium]|nr:hypothetical protein [Thermoanaerobaculia bacterium]
MLVLGHGRAAASPLAEPAAGRRRADPRLPLGAAGRVDVAGAADPGEAAWAEKGAWLGGDQPAAARSPGGVAADLGRRPG